MPQVPAPRPFGATRRSATPCDYGEDRAPAPGRDDRTAPKHTVVFFPPVLGGPRPRPGRGLVLDEQWAVAAEFTAGASVDMIGACGGLLCLLDVRTCTVRISNPLTGESLDLPPPPCTVTRRDPRAYCLGFDAAAGRYKIVHVPHDYKSANSSSASTGVVYVHSVGDKYWRPVRSLKGAAACCMPAGGAVYSGGAAYWLTHYKSARARLIRFDLSKEETTSVGLPPLDGGHRRRPLFCRLMDADAAPCVVTCARRDRASGEPFSAASDGVDVWRLGEDGAWGRACGAQLRRLPRRVPGPLAVRRGHLLLQGGDGSLYAHRIDERGVARIEGSGEKVLVEGSSRGRGGARTLADACGGGGEVGARVERESVVAILSIVALPLYRERLKSDGERVGRSGEKARVDCPARGGGRETVRIFGYVEHTWTAPLAKHLGPLADLREGQSGCRPPYSLYLSTK